MNTSIYIRVVVFGYKKQQDFANAIDANQSSVSRVETGEYNIPASWQRKIIALAKYRGLEFDVTLFFRPLSDVEIAALEKSNSVFHSQTLSASASDVTGKPEKHFPSSEHGAAE